MNTDEHRSEIILFILYLSVLIRVYLWFMLFSKEGFSPDEPGTCEHRIGVLWPRITLCALLLAFSIQNDDR